MDATTTAPGIPLVLTAQAKTVGAGRGSLRESPSGYWEAGPFVRDLMAEFSAAVSARRITDAEHRYEVVAAYCRRTLGIVRAALDDSNDALAVAALNNFMTLHDATVEMRRLAPRLVPDTAVVNRRERALLLEDHIIEVFDRSARPLTTAELSRRLADGGRTPAGEARLLDPHVDALVASGYLGRDPVGRLTRTGRRHLGVARGAAALDVLVGPRLRRILHDAGVRGVADVAADPERVASALGDVLAQRETLDAFVNVAERLARESRAMTRDGWSEQTLRPYQRDAFAALRSGGYAGLVMDAPAGSGKTLVGVMCILDWLEHLAPGQSVVVLVPTVIIQRQWVRELCYAPIGPMLAPHLVTTGTIRTLLATRSRVHSTPAVVIMTYASVADASSIDGAFDEGAIRRLVEGLDVQYALLDEVHGTAEHTGSATARAVQLLCQWRAAGMLQGIVGLSATAQPFTDRLAAIGLRVVVTVDDLELIANGFVSPFAEAGVPFGYSDRERQLRSLVTEYKDEMRAWLDAIGGSFLRACFAAIPLDERISIGRQLLHLSSRTPDHEADLAQRFTQWEQGGRLRLSELPLVTILQIARGWSDQDLAARAVIDTGDASLEIRSRRALTVFARLREAALELASSERALRRLSARVGTSLDHARLGSLLAADHLPPTQRWSAARDILASTVVGTFSNLRDETLHPGEGRVHTIAAIIDAERATRATTRVVVFERGGALRPADGWVVPGYRGLAGTFAALLQHDDSSVMAVLPHEVYLPVQQPSLSGTIASYLRRSLIGADLVLVLIEQLCVGLDLDDGRRNALAELAESLVATYSSSLQQGRAARVIDINGEVLGPLRRMVRGWASQMSMAVPPRVAVAERLSRRNPHLRSWVGNVIDHARLAAAFDRPTIVRMRGTDRATREVEIVHLPTGPRRQLAYELVGRLVDAQVGEPIPRIDTVVVSSWARGGWNVVTPNVLVDATATRDRVAWQQLRGRALRPWPSWTPERQAQLARTRARHPDDPAPAARLLLSHDKVAHIYELLKGYGNEPQVRKSDGGAWERIPALALKHRREHAVDLRSGHFGTGEAHAGLIIADDPRTDTPVKLQAELTALLLGADSRITRSWLRAARNL